MKAIFLDRNRVITEATTDYAIVILDGVDEFVEPVRNPNLVDQLNAVKGWGKPVLLRIVANAQWYSDSVNGIDKTDSWKYWLNKWLEDDTSAMVGLAKANLTPVDGLIITAWKDEAKGTTSAWVKMTMIEAMDMAKDWGLPTWAEFPLHIDQTWDKAQLATYCGNLKEYAVRPVEKTPTTSYEIIMPDNSLSYLPSITQPEIPETNSDILLPIEPLSQVDPRWKDIQLGTSSSTIGGYGCLITCVSMMLDYYGYNTNPALLNEELKGNAGYSNGNLLVWGAIPVIFPGVTYDGKWEGSRNDIIDKCLADGRPAIIHVDYNPATAPIEQHWVLVVGKVAGKYVINDPKDGKQVVFNDRYGDPATKIYNVASYDASIPEVDPPDEWIPSDDMDKALLTLPEILTEAKRTNVLLESVYKLLEANLFRGRL